MIMKNKSFSKAMAIGAACLALNSGISNNFTSFSNVAIAAKDPADQSSKWGTWWAKTILIIAGGVPGFGIGFVVSRIFN